VGDFSTVYAGMLKNIIKLWNEYTS
jgi:hypothetical protein